MRSKKSNWAIADANGKIIKHGFKYKPTAVAFSVSLRTHKKEKLKVVKDD